MTQDKIELILATIGATGVLASLLAALLPQRWQVTHWLSWWGTNVRRLPKGSADAQEDQEAAKGR